MRKWCFSEFLSNDEGKGIIRHVLSNPSPPTPTDGANLIKGHNHTNVPSKQECVGLFQ